MAYISNYGPSIDDQNDQTEELYVIDPLSKFQLDPTTNEAGDLILLKLSKQEKYIVAQQLVFLVQREPDPKNIVFFLSSDTNTCPTKIHLRTHTFLIAQ